MAEVTYGDAAEIRVTNLGRRGRANRNLHGFWLDLVKGRWLPERPSPRDETDDELEADLADVQAKARVIPYVEDRRNIASCAGTEPVEERRPSPPSTPSSAASRPRSSWRTPS